MHTWGLMFSLTPLPVRACEILVRYMQPAADFKPMNVDRKSVV